MKNKKGMHLDETQMHPLVQKNTSLPAFSLHKLLSTRIDLNAESYLMWSTISTPKH